MPDVDPSGHSVIILAGKFAGQEGACLGPVPDGSGRWAVSPDSSNEILSLEFPGEFGIVVNRGHVPGRN